MRTRIRYWSLSKLAITILGEERPRALTSEGWDEWTKDIKGRKPIRYWIVEEGLRKVQNFFYWPSDQWDNIHCKIQNRWKDKLWMVDTKLPRNQYYDIDSRLLHSMFSLLVDFVECELAMKWALWRDPQLPFKKRNAHYGLQHLEWEMGLKYEDTVPTQATDAKTIYDLYNWWKVTRPARKQPYEMVREDLDAAVSKADKTKCYDRWNEIKQQHFDEDTEMLMKLVGVRSSLWT